MYREVIIATVENEAVTPSGTDETLIPDVRAGLTPAQMVERKLVALMQTTPLPLSRLRMYGPRRWFS